MDDIMKIVIETEQRAKSNAHRLDAVEKKLEDYGAVITSIQVLAKRQEDMDCDIKEIKGDVKSLTEKPARRWESFVAAVISALAAAIVGYALAKLGIFV